jgi:hypothetical protein
MTASMGLWRRRWHGKGAAWQPAPRATVYNIVKWVREAEGVTSQ